MGIKSKLSGAKRLAKGIAKDGFAYTSGSREYSKRKAANPFTDIGFDEWKKQRLIFERRERKEQLLTPMSIDMPVFVVMVEAAGKSEQLERTKASLLKMTLKPKKVFYGQRSSMVAKMAEYEAEYAGRDVWSIKLKAGDELPSGYFFKLCPLAKDADIIYTDHELAGAKNADEVFLKPDLSEDYLCAHDYIGRSYIVKNRVPESMDEGSYEYLLKAIAEKKKILHSADTICALVNDEEAEDEEKISGLIKNVYESEDKKPAAVSVKTEGGINIADLSWKEKNKISVIIPNKDHAKDLKASLASLKKQTVYGNTEILIVENNSTEKETFDYYEELKKEKNIRVLYWKEGFNYSAINNFAAGEAKGDILLLMNNDVELINEDALSKMLSFVNLERVGVVGAKLYYADDTVQHAGVAVGFQGVGGHEFVGLAKGDHGYMMMADCVRRVSAVTAACLMIKKSVYDEVGGFDEEYAVAFNDVDLCMKVSKAGHQILYLPYACGYHFESKTRGNDTTDEEVARFGREVTRFLEKWKDELGRGDAFYNKNRSLNSMAEDRFRDLYGEG